jgi:histidinol phosphatase-like PHP family hydrolase
LLRTATVAGAPDTNATVAALLRDMAAVQTSTPRKWGYKRAASAILNLDQPLESYLQPDGTLRKIPNIGPATTRIILEVLGTGASPTVERALAECTRPAAVAAVESARALRTHFLSRAQVVAALQNAALNGPALADCRGDLQMHSEWSDGSDSLEEIVEGCLARGYTNCAITDHSYGLPIAGGISMADATRQHRAIDALNRRYRGRFRMLKGIEANIRADGTLDLQPDEAAQFEVVVASPHSALRTEADQTPRLLAAVTLPGVHVLGHPRGRMFGSRPGVHADWDAVFRAAAESAVAVEIDGDPARQDLDHALAARAVRAGCLFALDSDAHAAGELFYIETAFAHARLAGVPPGRVVNCWPLDRLVGWLESRRPRHERVRAVSSR